MNRTDPQNPGTLAAAEPSSARPEETADARTGYVAPTTGPPQAEPARARRPEAAVGRSFVVEVSPGPDADDFRGRVQHLATHDGGNFTSVEMLVSIIRRVLGRAEPDGPGER